MSTIGDYLKRRQESGLANQQANHHISGQQSPTGQTIGGRAGNPSVAAIPHAHPGKAGTPTAGGYGQGSTKSGARLTAGNHVQQTTTHTWSEA